MSRNVGRMHAEAAYLSLKAAQRRLNKAVGGLESGAMVTRVDRARLGRYGLAHEAMFAPVDVVADLEADAGEPFVTRTMADLAGYVLIAKPSVEPVALDARALGALAKEQGEALATFGEALADGKVTEDEAAKLRREILEAMTELARIDAALVALGTE